MLMSEKESGIFLVRDSNTIQGDFVLCVRYVYNIINNYTQIAIIIILFYDSREDGRVSHYIINRVVQADGNTRYRIGEQLFPDLPALLAFYRLHYLDSTPLVRPFTSVSQNPTTVLETVIAKYDFDGNVSAFNQITNKKN